MDDPYTESRIYATVHISPNKVNYCSQAVFIAGKWLLKLHRHSIILITKNLRKSSVIKKVEGRKKC